MGHASEQKIRERTRSSGAKLLHNYEAVEIASKSAVHQDTVEIRFAQSQESIRCKQSENRPNGGFKLVAQRR